MDVWRMGDAGYCLAHCTCARASMHRGRGREEDGGGAFQCMRREPHPGPSP